MSSTNVHSEKQTKIENIYCAGAQIIPTENELEIPPKNAKEGPSVSGTKLEINQGGGMEIAAVDSELNRDGKLIAKDGTIVVTFDPKAFSVIEAAHKKQKRVTKSNSNKNEGKEI